MGIAVRQISLRKLALWMWGEGTAGTQFPCEEKGVISAYIKRFLHIMSPMKLSSIEQVCSITDHS